MADYTVGSVTDAIAHQHVTHPQSVYGSAVTPTAGALYARIHMMHGFIEAAANTNPGSFYVQTTMDATNADNWGTVAQFRTFAGTPGSESPSGSEAVGQTTIEVAATAGFTAGDYIYFQDATTADSEWHQVDLIAAGVSIDLVDGLVNAKVNTDTMFTNAEHFFIELPLAGVARWRVTYKHEGTTGANTAIWVRYMEVTDFE